MLISPHFVFLHMPKTGGGSVTRALTESLPSDSWSSDTPRHPHAGWAQIPPSAADVPVLCFVRDPWDWYVSWYHFHRARETGGSTSNRAWRGSRRISLREDFASSVRAACAGEIRPVFAASVPACTDFYTLRFLDIVGEGLDTDRLVVGRFEHLFGDLEAFLRGAGAPVPGDFRRRVRALPAVHAVPHGAHREYYDSELRDLVGASCSLFVERFGYRF